MLYTVRRDKHLGARDLTAYLHVIVDTVESELTRRSSPPRDATD